MKLSGLLEADVSVPAQAGEVEVLGLSADSRDISSGFVFAALQGEAADGARFISQAVEKGACAVLVGADVRVDGAVSVPVLRSALPRRSFAKMAARFYGAQPETVVAVTGTSGKTSVVEFTRQIFGSLKLQAASLGTIGLVKPDGGTYGSLTTPDPIALHKILAELAGEGVTHLAFEASSHGLAQHRVDGVKLAAGAFTNLGRDHLDYHSSVEDYLQAKLRLFRELLEPGQPAVINVDGAYSDEALSCASERGLTCLTVGCAGGAIKLESVEPDGFCQRLMLGVDGKRVAVKLPLIGAYQVENALTAAGLALALGCDVDGVMGALHELQGVKGRLDVAGEARGGLIIVDYAHKPEALRAALSAVKPFVTGRLICVFGCGGDRDRGKRSIMGAIASEMCDMVIVTDDNPRSEDAASIRAEVLAGASGAVEVGSRGDAISEAVGMIGRGDVVVIAGKGHETGQIVGDEVLPFSDFEAVSLALAAIS